MQKKIYLAGPEVFLPDSQEVGRQKQAICASYGVVGLYPGDNGPFESRMSRAELSRVIFLANVALIREADLLVANLTPFRGPSADPGTVWELGFMAGLGKPVHGYSNTAASLLDRTRALDENSRWDPETGLWRDAGGLTIEDLDGSDNLMIVESIALAGGHFVTHDIAPHDRDRDLTAFEACLRLLIG